MRPLFLQFMFKQHSRSVLVDYFASGWIFLIPYLTAYVIYWLAELPVRPEPDRTLSFPSLLGVYGILHIVHLVLAGYTLAQWLREGMPGRSLLSRLIPVFPWICLALIFWIPGAYLEFPSDPWEHLRRINEWGAVETVAAHSTANKTSYLLPYSLLAGLSIPQRLFWLDVYYTCICLLLCWQYYRLARSIGLGSRPAFIFVLLQAVLFGNNVFSFYRYYGLASTMYSQLGAVALVRIGLEFAAGLKSGVPWRETFVPALRASGAALLLVPLVAFNHVQGLGMAALGLLAVIAWKLVAWKRTAVWWLLVLVVALSLAAIEWWPRHPALDAIYRPEGWLTAWYGFRMLPIDGAAGDRATVIIGLVGALNLGAAILLLRRNHVAGWLVITPVLALCLPFVVIPIANSLAQHPIGPGYIITYHRLLLGIPVALALVTVFSGLPPRLIAWLQRQAWGLLLLGLTALVVVPPGGPYYNRLWHTFVKPPADLMFHEILVDPVLVESAVRGNASAARPIILTTNAAGNVLSALGANVGSDTLRVHWNSPAMLMDRLIQQIDEAARAGIPLRVIIPRAENVQTPRPQAAFLSDHWSGEQVALDYAGGAELDVLLKARGWRRVETSAAIYFFPGE